MRVAWFGPSPEANERDGDMWWSASFAVREANDQGGALGLPIRLIPCWSGNPWGAGVSQLVRLIYDEHPVAILGSVDSASTHLAEQVVAKAQLPLVSPVSTDCSVTLAGVSWMFVCAPSDAAIARILVNGVLATLGASQSQKLVLLACTDHESRMTTLEVLKEFNRREHLPDFRFDVPPGAENVAEQMAALIHSRPAVVLIIAGAEDSARLVQAVRAECPTIGNRSARSSKPAVPSDLLIFGSHKMSCSRFLELAGAAAEGVRFPLLFVPSAGDTNQTHFMDCFVANRRHTPDYTAALTYDGTRLLIDAIRHGGVNRPRVREALTTLSPWSGLAGSISFDGTGQNVRTNLCLGTIRDGAVVPVPSQ